MSKRKIKIIDKKFQLRTTFSIIGVIIIAYLVIVAVIVITGAKNNREISGIVKNLNELRVIENKSVKTFLDQAGVSPGFKANADQFSKEHRNRAEMYNQNALKMQDFASDNLRLISISVGILILLSVALYYHLIKVTHRISGPIYVISKQIDMILEGKNPEFRKLRDDDELRDFYANFIKMVGKLRKNQS